MERSERLYVRLTPLEKQTLVNAAKLAGMTVTGYLLYKLGEDLGYEIADKAVTALSNKKESSK